MIAGLHPRLAYPFGPPPQPPQTSRCVGGVLPPTNAQVVSSNKSPLVLIVPLQSKQGGVFKPISTHPPPPKGGGKKGVRFLRFPGQNLALRSLRCSSQLQLFRLLQAGKSGDFCAPVFLLCSTHARAHIPSSSSPVVPICFCARARASEVCVIIAL